jgi:hypothetical protein
MVPNNWDKQKRYRNWEKKRLEKGHPYMPTWPIEKCTHYQFWQSKTDNTPVSPTFATPKELALYLIEHRTSPYFEPWYRAHRGRRNDIAMAIREDGEDYVSFLRNNPEYL